MTFQLLVQALYFRSRDIILNLMLAKNNYSLKSTVWKKRVGQATRIFKYDSRNRCGDSYRSRHPM